MKWSVIIVLVLLLGYVVNASVNVPIREYFSNTLLAPPRSDIGLAADGWGEESGYRRDLRYSEAFVDLQGIGAAVDFCRAIVKKSTPNSLHMSCALGRRDGMDTMEYNSRTLGGGFRFSRDDYWRTNPVTGRSDYCRILKDEGTDTFRASCALATRAGFGPQEEFDTDPPPYIQDLLEAYEGALVWFRWQDDRDDYAENAAFTIQGTPTFPTMLRPEVSRGLQLNRWPMASQDAGEIPKPLTDSLRWGEKGTLELNQTISPRSVRAIACWVWWDGFEKGATILDSRNPMQSSFKMDRIALGVEGGGPATPALSQQGPASPALSQQIPAPNQQSPAPNQQARITKAVTEVRPEVLESIGQLTEPATLARPIVPGSSASYYFEIWDKEQRIMRLDGPGSAKAGEWQHVAVTVTDSADWWPTWQLWINGHMIAEKTDGRLSPAMTISDNYIGRNMRGCIQDLRIYSTPLAPAKLQKAIAWSKPKLHPLP